MRAAPATLAVLLAIASVAGCDDGGASAPHAAPQSPLAAVPASAATIADPLGFLVQTRCPNGGPPTGCAAPARQRAADPMFYRRHDWPAPSGYQTDDSVLRDDGKAVIDLFSFAPFEGFVAAHGDGGQIMVADSDTVRIAQTQDGGTPGMQYFVGPNCGGTGWIAFRTDAPTGRYAALVATLSDRPDPNACPRRLAKAYTRYRLETIALPFIIGDARRDLTAPTVISEHYDRDTVERATAMERTYFAQGWGLVRWEAWTASGRAGSGLDRRCPPLAYSEAPAAGWRLADCRIWTNIAPADGSLSVDGVGWP
ncbi:MAG: hypothetical protein JO038_07585 [Alphaproteobacteria bacterium]|nr:hypothetical protein [Alphaproteobacteria bacterium]